MSYCRMRNTLEDLRDCYENMDEVEHEDEKEARTRLVELCRRIADDYGDQYGNKSVGR
jgi:hypothetical protein